ncbi:hypothetical protein [Pantoea vagans]|uniref:hypothetical protein n=1 Tax=Pantoea vagans TaxID=470934 RepID=UPI0023B1FA83|nr:hypothetical protein [Pantoea vagans]MDE8556086.1 hypothetical protein [Pantoea vagans]MDE8576137.1 hypothetical protein [Pantoea vagans]
MKTPLEVSRNRLVNCYLLSLNAKTGSFHTTAKLPEGSITTVQLDAEILNKALIKLFETAVRKVTPAAAADREIAATYGDCVKIKSGKLSHIGEGFMEELVSNLVEQAFQQRGAQ